MQILNQILQLPIWLIIVLLILIGMLMLISLRTGRELHFWPPSIGPTIEKSKLEEEIKRLQDRLQEADTRYSNLKTDADLSKERVQDELKNSQKKLQEAEQKCTELQEKLAATWRPMSSEQHISILLPLFDRQAMRVPTHEEHFGNMISSLEDLRNKLQQFGISTIRNPLIRELFEKIKKDLEWIEGIVLTLAQKNIMKSQIFNAPGTSSEIRRLDKKVIKPVPLMIEKEFDDTHLLIETMVERAWRGNHQTTKEVTSSEVVNSMTASWFFASIDRTRLNMLSEIIILRRLLEQDI